MLKSLVVVCGVLAFSATGLHAQGAHGFAGRGSAAGRPAAYREANHYGGYSHGYRGRYYYLGGVPYFYPFGFGFGDPFFYGGYGGFYGGYGDGYGYGYGGGEYPSGDAAYNGRVADNGQGSRDQGTGGSLPQAVQQQLARRGFYKGSVDGQFGPESRSALSRFQKKQGLKETGRIDEPTLQALGFTDRR